MILYCRHHTSKCHSLSDLNTNLSHFGFRGEALASIANVSRSVEIVSRHDDNDMVDGINTFVKIFSCDTSVSLNRAEEQRPSVGTTITVRGLLYCLPIRRKNVRMTIDFENIKLHLEALALIHPQISFSLKNEQRGDGYLLQTAKCGSTIEMIGDIYGEQLASSLAQLDHHSHPFFVKGFIGKLPYHNKSFQFVYINKRLVLKTLIHKFMNQLIQKTSILTSRLPPVVFNNNLKNKSPSSPPKWLKLYGMFVIEIICPYHEYDILLDPAKTLVEFKQWPKLFSCIEQCFIKFASQQNIFINIENKSLSKEDENSEEDEAAPIVVRTNEKLQIFSHKRKNETVVDRKNKFAKAISVYDVKCAVQGCNVRRSAAANLLPDCLLSDQEFESPNLNSESDKNFHNSNIPVRNSLQKFKRHSSCSSLTNNQREHESSTCSILGSRNGSPDSQKPRTSRTHKQPRRVTHDMSSSSDDESPYVAPTIINHPPCNENVSSIQKFCQEVAKDRIKVKETNASLTHSRPSSIEKFCSEIGRRHDKYSPVREISSAVVSPYVFESCSVAIKPKISRKDYTNVRKRSKIVAHKLPLRESAPTLSSVLNTNLRRQNMRIKTMKTLEKFRFTNATEKMTDLPMRVENQLASKISHREEASEDFLFNPVIITKPVGKSRFVISSSQFTHSEDSDIRNAKTSVSSEYCPNANDNQFRNQDLDIKRSNELCNVRSRNYSESSTANDVMPKVTGEVTPGKDSDMLCAQKSEENMEPLKTRVGLDSVESPYESCLAENQSIAYKIGRCTSGKSEAFPDTELISTYDSHSSRSLFEAGTSSSKNPAPVESSYSEFTLYQNSCTAPKRAVVQLHSTPFMSFLSLNLETEPLPLSYIESAKLIRSVGDDLVNSPSSTGPVVSRIPETPETSVNTPEKVASTSTQMTTEQHFPSEKHSFDSQSQINHSNTPNKNSSLVCQDIDSPVDEAGSISSSRNSLWLTQVSVNNVSSNSKNSEDSLLLGSNITVIPSTNEEPSILDSQLGKADENLENNKLQKVCEKPIFSENNAQKLIKPIGGALSLANKLSSKLNASSNQITTPIDFNDEWSESFDDNGRKIYINRRSGNSSYHPPPRQRSRDNCSRPVAIQNIPITSETNVESRHDRITTSYFPINPDLKAVKGDRISLVDKLLEVKNARKQVSPRSVFDDQLTENSGHVTGSDCNNLAKISRIVTNTETDTSSAVASICDNNAPTSIAMDSELVRLNCIGQASKTDSEEAAALVEDQEYKFTKDMLKNCKVSYSTSLNVTAV